MNELSYEELWIQIKEGSKEALGELIQRFEPLIRSQSIINGIYNEDVAQEIRFLFIKAVKYKSLSDEITLMGNKKLNNL